MTFSSVRRGASARRHKAQTLCEAAARLTTAKTFVVIRLRVYFMRLDRGRDEKQRDIKMDQIHVVSNIVSLPKTAAFTMVHYKLVYNKLRWLAEPIRLMFVYAGEEFEDVRLDWDEFHKAKLGKFHLLS